LINTSRGQLIDDIALLEALKDGTVESAALDTLYPDPEYNKLPEDSTYSHFLIHHPKVYYTPHIAAGSRDALEDVAEALAKKMRTFFGIDQTTFR
jgi:phosphoglycerate dehydrogenase-like enzyme